MLSECIFKIALEQNLYEVRVGLSLISEMLDPKMMVAYSSDPEEDCASAGSSGRLRGKFVLTYVASSVFDLGFFSMAYLVFISSDKEQWMMLLSRI